MLKKIIAVENVGKFINCNAAGDVEFRRLTLIYGENGRGKTTLCDIFRSLATGDPGYVTGRKTLGNRAPQSITIRFDAQSAVFKDVAWSTTLPKLAIFDSAFVHENVYAGEYVDHDHKKNLYRVIVGEHGVSLARKVEDIGEQIKDAAREAKEKLGAVSAHVPKGMTADNFVALPKLDDVAEQIIAKEREIASLKRANEIKAKNALAPVNLPSLPDDFAALLGHTLKDVSRDAEQRVRDQLRSHTQQATESWLSDGLGFVRNETCPFCGQSLKRLDLIAAYRTYFGQSYSALKSRIAAMEASVTKSMGQNALLNLQGTIANNSVLVEFWKDFVPVDGVAFSFEDTLAPVLDALRRVALDYLNRKGAAPLDPLSAGSDFDAALAHYQEAKHAVDLYNAAIETTNKLIAAKKASADPAKLSKAEQDLARLQAIKKRHEPDADAACREYRQATQQKTALEQNKDAAKRELDRYANKTFAQYQTRINRYLELFNAGFRITDTKRSYAGGLPSSSYQVLINNVPVDLGTPNTPVGQPSFRNTLSAGDRSTLALAFFLAQLDQNPGLAEHVVVFDDPFSSQDASRRTCTQQLICKLFERAKQVIVLSHSPTFLKLIWDNAAQATVKTLQLFRLGTQDTTITEWDIEDETRGDYFQNHGVLTTYLNDDAGDKRRVAQAIRPVLEKYLRFKLPRQFADDDWLGNMIKSVREAQVETPLQAAKVIIDEVTNINDYSKKYHHDQNPGGFDTEPIDDGELQAYVKRTLDVVGGF